MFQATELALRQLSREDLAAWLPTLSGWLLPDAFYPAEHTWPQVYRSDGSADCLGIFHGDQLVSHLAVRTVELCCEREVLRAGLIGSVATDPSARGQGLAGALLEEAVGRCRAEGLDLVVLWAERPDLYARHGFAFAGQEQVAILRPVPCPIDGARIAEHRDHAALLALHRQKPWHVVRDQKDMSLLLSTPGMCTTVLEREEEIVAYACLGKGADFAGWWHEVGGADPDVATLLRQSLQLLEMPMGMLLVPPYRSGLSGALADVTAAMEWSDGPMVVALTPAAEQSFWVDGLDSI